METARKLAPVQAVQPRLEPGDILTPEELAKRLKVSKSWVYEKSRASGSYGRTTLPGLRCGHYLRFDWNAVRAWLRSENRD